MIYFVNIFLEWMGGCCLTSSEQLFSFIMARTGCISTRLWWRWCPICSIYQHTNLDFDSASWLLDSQKLVDGHIILNHQSLLLLSSLLDSQKLVDGHIILNHQSLLLLFNTTYIVEKQKIPIL